MINIHIRIIGLNHVGGVLKSSDQALFRSMQQKIHICHIKGDFQCSSLLVFQYNEKISQKIHQKNPSKYFFQFFSNVLYQFFNWALKISLHMTHMNFLLHTVKENWI